MVSVRKAVLCRSFWVVCDDVEVDLGLAEPEACVGALCQNILRLHSKRFETVSSHHPTCAAV